jgi:DNA-directed RNA polymerase subunit beta
MIPSRGAWLEFEVDKRDTVGVRLDRKRKQNVTVLLKALGWTEAQILEEFGEYESIRLTLEKDHTTGQDDALLDIYRKLRPGEPPTREAAQTLLDNYYFNPKRYDLAKVGRYKINKKLGQTEPFDQQTLTIDDIVAAIRYIVELHDGRTELTTADNSPVLDPEGKPVVVEADDIDHFGNRRMRTVGELIQNQLRTGLARMERVVRERMTTQDVEAITPQTLINIRPVVAGAEGVLRHLAAEPVHGPDQPDRRPDAQASPVGTRPRWSEPRARRLRGARRAPSHYGRMCPIETPEGPNIGLIGSLSTYGRVNPFGFRRDALPQGHQGPGHRHSRLPHRRRGGPLRHRAGERAADREEPLRRRARARPAAARGGRLRPRRRRRLHGRLTRARWSPSPPR